MDLATGLAKRLGNTVPASTSFNFEIRDLAVSLPVNVPLPVELVSFTAVAEAPATVRLAWATASETHSAYFAVERSTDGTRYAPVGQVAAAGTSATAHAYGLTDVALPAGAALLYYRLRQVDQDGTSHYSLVRPVAIAPAATGLRVYPTPASAAATLTGAPSGAAVQVFDARGRRVAAAMADATGTAALAAGLPPGVYVVRSGSRTARWVVE
ncbi:T9SS type A sorting domain-containing protein [Hymenobacter caeli]